MVEIAATRQKKNLHARTSFRAHTCFRSSWFIETPFFRTVHWGRVQNAQTHVSLFHGFKAVEKRNSSLSDLHAAPMHCPKKWRLYEPTRPKTSVRAKTCACARFFSGVWQPFPPLFTTQISLSYGFKAVEKWNMGLSVLHAAPMYCPKKNGVSMNQLDRKQVCARKLVRARKKKFWRVAAISTTFYHPNFAFLRL